MSKVTTYVAFKENSLSDFFLEEFADFKLSWLKAIPTKNAFYVRFNSKKSIKDEEILEKLEKLPFRDFWIQNSGHWRDGIYDYQIYGFFDRKKMVQASIEGFYLDVGGELQELIVKYFGSTFNRDDVFEFLEYQGIGTVSLTISFYEDVGVSDREMISDEFMSYLAEHLPYDVESVTIIEGSDKNWYEYLLSLNPSKV